MATLQDRLASLLLSDTTIQGMVGDNVDWDVSTQGATGPRIIMFLISEGRDYTFSGDDGLREARIQFDCRANTSLASRQLAEALDSLLSGYRTKYGGVDIRGCFKEGHRTRFDMDGGTRWFQAQLDYRIWWKSAS